MNLYLFPAPSDNRGGYNIAVKDAYQKFSPKDSDVVVWANLAKRPECAKSKDYVVYYKPFKSFHTISKLCSGYLNNEFSSKELSFLKGMDFEQIHCDDVVFYRAIRELYPDKPISVRFHNVFSRIYDRCLMLNIHTNLRFHGKMYLSRFLEKKIFMDRYVFKYFLTNEDAEYYHLLTGSTDYQVWPFNIRKKILVYEPIQHIIWFGGVEGHKQTSVEWFINDVWHEISKQKPDVDFHLYGKYTEKYNDSSCRIVGHGRYLGEDLPYVSTSLYINPDLMGGGIKIKVKSYFEKGARFISTPFGFEGYDKEFIDNNQCFVVPPHEWCDYLLNIL